MPYSLPGARRSHSTSSYFANPGAFSSLGHLPRRRTTTDRVFHFNDDHDDDNDNDDDDDNDNDRDNNVHRDTSPSPPPPPPPTQVSGSSPVVLANGKPLKSSLKSSSSLSSSPAFTPHALFHTRTRSEPSIPVLKNVHFPAPGQLASVRTFNRSARPASITAATDDTETEGETSEAGNSGVPFPRLGRLAPTAVATACDVDPALSSHIPAVDPPPYANVHLESLCMTQNSFASSLASTSTSPPPASLTGSILVRNIAYTKHVAVRFTLDAWQTVSEVQARYVESLYGHGHAFDIARASARNGQPDRSSHPTWDRFAFSIRLEDYLPRLAGRQMYLAVRFCVGAALGADRDGTSQRVEQLAGVSGEEAGEWWDNNGGANYVVVFRAIKGANGSAAANGSVGGRARETSPTPAVSSSTSASSSSSSTSTTNNTSTIPSQSTQDRTRSRSQSQSPQRGILRNRQSSPPDAAQSEVDNSSTRVSSESANMSGLRLSTTRQLEPQSDSEPVSSHTQVQQHTHGPGSIDLHLPGARRKLSLSNYAAPTVRTGSTPSNSAANLEKNPQSPVSGPGGLLSPLSPQLGMTMSIPVLGALLTGVAGASSSEASRLLAGSPAVVGVGRSGLAQSTGNADDQSERKESAEAADTASERARERGAFASALGFGYGYSYGAGFGYGYGYGYPPDYTSPSGSASVSAGSVTPTQIQGPAIPRVIIGGMPATFPIGVDPSTSTSPLTVQPSLLSQPQLTPLNAAIAFPWPSAPVHTAGLSALSPLSGLSPVASGSGSPAGSGSRSPAEQEQRQSLADEHQGVKASAQVVEENDDVDASSVEEGSEDDREGVEDADERASSSTADSDEAWVSEMGSETATEVVEESENESELNRDADVPGSQENTNVTDLNSNVSSLRPSLSVAPVPSLSLSSSSESSVWSPATPGEGPSRSAADADASPSTGGFAEDLAALTSSSTNDDGNPHARLLDTDSVYRAFVTQWCFAGSAPPPDADAAAYGYGQGYASTGREAGPRTRRSGRNHHRSGERSHASEHSPSGLASEDPADAQYGYRYGAHGHGHHGARHGPGQYGYARSVPYGEWGADEGVVVM